jgi:hypothetical protein
MTPFRFLNVVSLVMYWLLGSLASTERAKARLWQNQWAKNGLNVSGGVMLRTDMDRPVVHPRHNVTDQRPVNWGAPPALPCRRAGCRAHERAAPCETRLAASWSDRRAGTRCI